MLEGLLLTVSALCLGWAATLCVLAWTIWRR